MGGKRIRGILVVLCLGAAVSCGGGQRGGAPPERPNVVLIVVDTLRADHLSSFGYSRPTTPNLDRLAAESVVFRNAQSAAPWTTPSVGALFTSQYPSALGIGSQPGPIGERFPTLAELLKADGYNTQGIISVSMLTSKLGFGRGFDGYDESACAERSESSSPQVTDAAIRFLRERGDEPFFLFVHYFDPHYNYLLHPEHDFFPDYQGRLESGTPIQLIWRDRLAFDAADLDYLRALYDSEIRFTDDHVGRLLDELDELGLLDRSLVVFTADHGEEFMERGWIGHTRSLHRELLHVPLMFRLPGGAAGTVEEPVGLVDVLPTVLDRLGLPIPEGLEGTVLPLAEPFRVQPRAIFAETSNPQIHQPGRVRPIDLKSMVYGRTKLIYDGVSRSAELYDLAEDPAESTDLAASQQDRAARLLGVLESWVAQARLKREGQSTESIEELLTDEQLEELRSLGYIR